MRDGRRVGVGEGDRAGLGLASPSGSKTSDPSSGELTASSDDPCLGGPRAGRLAALGLAGSRLGRRLGLLRGHLLLGLGLLLGELRVAVLLLLGGVGDAVGAGAGDEDAEDARSRPTSRGRSAGSSPCRGSRRTRSRGRRAPARRRSTRRSSRRGPFAARSYGDPRSSGMPASLIIDEQQGDEGETRMFSTHTRRSRSLGAKASAFLVTGCVLLAGRGAWAGRHPGQHALRRGRSGPQRLLRPFGPDGQVPFQDRRRGRDLEEARRRRVRGRPVADHGAQRQSVRDPGRRASSAASSGARSRATARWPRTSAASTTRRGSWSASARPTTRSTASTPAQATRPRRSTTFRPSRRTSSVMRRGGPVTTTRTATTRASARTRASRRRCARSSSSATSGCGPWPMTTGSRWSTPTRHPSSAADFYALGRGGARLARRLRHPPSGPSGPAARKRVPVSAASSSSSRAAETTPSQVTTEASWSASRRGSDIGFSRGGDDCILAGVGRRRSPHRTRQRHGHRRGRQRHHRRRPRQRPDSRPRRRRPDLRPRRILRRDRVRRRRGQRVHRGSV